MSITTVTSKGTTTIPKEIRDYLGVKPGSSVQFTKDKAGNIRLSRVYTLEEIRLRNQAHIKKNNIKQLSPEELKQVVEQGRAREAIARYKQA
jgi:AbrB family looped-hinge helix DNA binding protein